MDKHTWVESLMVSLQRERDGDLRYWQGSAQFAAPGGQHSAAEKDPITVGLM